MHWQASCDVSGKAARRPDTGQEEVAKKGPGRHSPKGRQRPS